MRPPSKFGKPAAKTLKKKYAKTREPTACRFCREKFEDIDYKDLTSLHRLVTAQGKMLPRKRSGNCATHQRAARRAIKRARFVALMSFIS